VNRGPTVLDWLVFYFDELAGWRRHRRRARLARRYPASGPEPGQG
jgi:hypothetical protein